jgi:protein-disulfide isomerase
MSRLNIVVYLVLGIVIGALATSLANRGAHPVTDTAAVQAIVDKAIAAHDADRPVAAVDAKTIDPLIENYLMRDPHVLERVSAELDRQNRAAAAQQAATLIAANKTDIFDAPGQIVVGNPKGDVTLVEMFDYNCGFCRAALPDLAQLLTEDKDLRVVLKEFPILGPGSVAAAKVAVAVSRTGADYWAFHQALYESRGAVTEATALDEARTLGLDPAEIKSAAAAPEIAAVIQSSYALAGKLGVNGTPTYIIGDAIIPGAVDISVLRQAISNMRACGKTSCQSTTG